MENIDGILGMSRRWFEPNVYSTGPLFIDALYNQTKITENIFSFYIAKTDTESYVDIGFIRSEAFKGGNANAAGLVWFDIPTDSNILFWYVRTTAIRFGDVDEQILGVSQAYSFDKYIAAILDTGTSTTLIPRAIAADFFGRLLQGQRYSQLNGMYQISCANKDVFPSIFLMVDGYWLEIHPSDYVLDLDIEGQQGCLLSLMAADIPYFILGDSFLRGYYSVHDHTNNRIGLAPHNTSPKRRIELGQLPRYKQSEVLAENKWLYNVASYWNQFVGWFWIPIVFSFCCCFTCCVTLCLLGEKLESMPTPPSIDGLTKKVQEEE